MITWSQIKRSKQKEVIGRVGSCVPKIKRLGKRENLPVYARLNKDGCLSTSMRKKNYVKIFPIQRRP
jgi:hypothetical protein